VTANQAALAKPSLIWSDWSAWSEPVGVDRSDYFFVTSAADRGVTGPAPRASAELYVFYYGYWRRASVSLEPGDMLSGEAKLPAELDLYDLSKIPKPEDPNAAAPPGGVPPPPPPGGGGPGGGRFRPREGEVAPPPNQPPTLQPPTSPQDGLLAGVPKTTAPTNKTIKVDAVFMDVAKRVVASLGGSKDVFDAVLRDGVGRIVARSPENEKATDLYKRLDQSAKDGLTQGKPVVKEEPVAPRPIPQPTKESPRPPRPPGGGGGGGGGGGAGATT
jgi:hypothetical protein